MVQHMIRINTKSTKVHCMAFWHQPLALFGPNKEIPLLDANCWVRWALMLSQNNYSVELQKTLQRGNANALSRLLVGIDLRFDGEEIGENMDNVCTFHMIGCQMLQVDPKLLLKKQAKIQAPLKSFFV